MTKSTEPTIKRCPFCGESAKRHGSNMVICDDQTNCGANVDWGHYTEGDGPVEAWNRRDDPDIHDAEIRAAMAEAQLRELEAQLIEKTATLKRLDIFLSALDDGPQPTKVIDNICAIVVGRTDVTVNEENQDGQVS